LGTNYYVKVTDSLGCTTYDGITVYVDGNQVTVNSFENTGFIKFKNPIEQGNCISFENKILGSSFQIITLDGSLIYNKIIDSNTLNVNEITNPKGIFIYKITNEGSEVCTGKNLIN
jgi:hypothetical protein